MNGNVCNITHLLHEWSSLSKNYHSLRKIHAQIYGFRGMGKNINFSPTFLK